MTKLNLHYATTLIVSLCQKQYIKFCNTSSAYFMYLHNNIYVLEINKELAKSIQLLKGINPERNKTKLLSND